MTTLASPTAPRERCDSRLGRNLVLARQAAGMTQHELARLAGVSRATVAQIESGRCDPRLSTVVLLADALQVHPLLLLIGPELLEALIAAQQGHLPDPLGALLSPREVDQMLRLVGSGHSRDSLQAGWIGSLAARNAGMDSPGRIGAGIGSGMVPGAGTRFMAALANLLSGRRDS